MINPLPNHLVDNDIPLPVLFNTWKHHAGELRCRIAESAAAGEAGLLDLAQQLVVLGSELMDLYVGALSATDIADRVLEQLQTQNIISNEAYQAWLQANGGYGMLICAEDQSRWVLRQGPEDGRYVHIHPGRWSPATRRVRANVLKTAVQVNAYVQLHGGQPLEIQLVNKVRQQYLGLSPMRAVGGDQGLAPVIAVLQATAG